MIAQDRATRTSVPTRTPAFLQGALGKRQEVSLPPFSSALRQRAAEPAAAPAPPHAHTAPAHPQSPAPQSPPPQAPPLDPVVIPNEVQSLAPPLPPPEHDMIERVTAALNALRLVGERLAEEARADALELGVLIARRILESEVTTSIEPLFGLIRSALRRAGEARKVTIRLSPNDAESVSAGAAADRLRACTIAEIQVLVDPDLERGDVVVETELGTVDGRLSTRAEELRRALTAALQDESGT